MRLLICAGGTGGGVYPALAVLEVLQEDEPSEGKDEGAGEPSLQLHHQLELLWVGGAGGIEVELLRQKKVDFVEIPAAGIHGVGLSALPGNIWQIIKGFFASRRILNDFCPEVMFFTGGYLAVPMALAGRFIVSRRRRPKSLLYVPDIEPGLALQTLARFSDQIALTVEESMAYFRTPTKLVVTGYPTRRDLGSWSLKNARQVLNVLSNWPTLLVFGGSKGARSINRALLAQLPQLLEEMQIVHISGHLDWPEVEVIKTKLSDDLALRYHAYPYLHEEMGAALRVADIVVSRAGASVLGELPLFGLPAILVPYPYAWRYQEVNARYLERRGAAVVIQDERLADELLPAVKRLISNERQREKMQQAMRSLAKPNAAESVADLLHGLVSVPNPGRI